MSMQNPNMMQIGQFLTFFQSLYHTPSSSYDAKKDGDENNKNKAPSDDKSQRGTNQGSKIISGSDVYAVLKDWAELDEYFRLMRATDGREKTKDQIIDKEILFLKREKMENIEGWKKRTHDLELQQFLQNFQVLSTQKLAEKVLLTPDTTHSNLLSLPSKSTIYTAETSDENENQPELLIAPTLFSWREFLRLSLMVCALSPSNIEKASDSPLCGNPSLIPRLQNSSNKTKSKLTSSAANMLLADKSEILRSDIVALWIRAQRNGGALRHLIQLFSIDKKEIEEDGEDMENDIHEEDDQYQKKNTRKKVQYVAKFVGNTTKTRTKVLNDTSTLESLVNFVIAKQVLSNEYQNSEFIHNADSNDVNDPFNDYKKKRKHDIDDKDHGNYSQKKKKALFMTPISPSPPETIDKVSEKSDQLARRSLILRWFVRRNRNALTNLFSSQMHKDIEIDEIDTEGNVQKKACWDHIQNQIKKYTRRMGTTDRTFARIDRRIFTKYEGQEEFCKAVKLLLKGLFENAPDTEFLNQVQRAMQDFNIFEQNFFNPTKKDPSMYLNPIDDSITDAGSVIPELPPPWIDQCRSCKKTINDHDEKTLCRCCGYTFHKKCASIDSPWDLRNEIFNAGKIDLNQYEWGTKIKKIIHRKGKNVGPISWGLSFEPSEEFSAEIALYFAGNWSNNPKEGTSTIFHNMKHSGLVVTSVSKSEEECGLQIGDLIIRMIDCDSKEEYELGSMIDRDELFFVDAYNRFQVIAFRPSEPFVALLNRNCKIEYCKDCEKILKKIEKKKDIEPKEMTKEKIIFEAKTCRNIIRRLGMESSSLHFHDEHWNDSSFGQVPFVSLRRIDHMMTSIIKRNEGEPNIKHLMPLLDPFLEPLINNKNVMDVQKMPRRVSWAPDGVEQRPCELLCLGMQMILRFEGMSSDPLKKEREDLARRFIPLLSSWCFHARSADNDVVRPMTSIVPWVYKACQVCGVKKQCKSVQELREGKVCATSLCDEPFCESYLKSLDQHPIKDRNFTSAKSKDLEKRSPPFDDWLSLVGTVILVIPGDPIHFKICRTLKFSIEHMDRLIEVLILSYSPNQDGGSFCVIPILSNTQLYNILEYCKVHGIPSPSKSKMMMSSQNEGVKRIQIGLDSFYSDFVYFSCSEIEYCINETLQIRVALDREIYRLVSYSPNEDPDRKHFTSNILNHEGFNERVKISDHGNLHPNIVSLISLSLFDDFDHESLHQQVFFDVIEKDDLFKDQFQLHKYNGKSESYDLIAQTHTLEYVALINALVHESDFIRKFVTEIHESRKKLGCNFPDNFAAFIQYPEYDTDVGDFFTPYKKEAMNGCLHHEEKIISNYGNDLNNYRVCYVDFPSDAMVPHLPTSDSNKFFSKSNSNFERLMIILNRSPKTQLTVNSDEDSDWNPEESADKSLKKINTTNKKPSSTLYKGKGWGLELLKWSNDKKRLRVGRIVPNSPAHTSTIFPHDIVISINGKNVQSIGPDFAIARALLWTNRIENPKEQSAYDLSTNPGLFLSSILPVPAEGPVILEIMRRIQSKNPLQGSISQLDQSPPVTYPFSTRVIGMEGKTYSPYNIPMLPLPRQENRHLVKQGVSNQPNYLKYSPNVDSKKDFTTRETDQYKYHSHSNYSSTSQAQMQAPPQHMQTQIQAQSNRIQARPQHMQTQMQAPPQHMQAKMQAQPNQIQARPQHMRSQIQAQPNQVQARPQHMQPQIQAQPNQIQARPQHMRSQIQAQPNQIQARPQHMQAQPNRIQLSTHYNGAQMQAQPDHVQAPTNYLSSQPNHIKTRNREVHSNTNMNTRPIFTFELLYASGFPRSMLTCAETITLVQAICSDQPKLGFRLLYPRYSFDLIQSEYKTFIQPQMRSHFYSIPKLHENDWQAIIAEDYKRSLTETGPVIFQEDKYSYRKPTKILPLDRILENSMRRDVHRNVPHTQALISGNFIANSRVSTVSFIIGKQERETNVEINHQRSDTEYEVIDLIDSSNEVQNLNGSTYDNPQRIRGGGNDKSHKVQQDSSNRSSIFPLPLTNISSAIWAKLPVFSQCITTVNSVESGEAKLIGVVLKPVPSPSPDQAIVRVCHVSNVGYLSTYVDQPIASNLLYTVSCTSQEYQILRKRPKLNESERVEAYALPASYMRSLIVNKQKVQPKASIRMEEEIRSKSAAKCQKECVGDQEKGLNVNGQGIKDKAHQHVSYMNSLILEKKSPQSENIVQVKESIPNKIVTKDDDEGKNKNEPKSYFSYDNTLIQKIQSSSPKEVEKNNHLTLIGKPQNKDPGARPQYNEEKIVSLNKTKMINEESRVSVSYINSLIQDNKDLHSSTINQANEQNRFSTLAQAQNEDLEGAQKIVIDSEIHDIEKNFNHLKEDSKSELSRNGLCAGRGGSQRTLIEDKNNMNEQSISQDNDNSKKKDPAASISQLNFLIESKENLQSSEEEKYNEENVVFHNNKRFYPMSKEISRDSVTVNLNENRDGLGFEKSNKMPIEKHKQPNNIILDKRSIESRINKSTKGASNRKDDGINREIDNHDKGLTLSFLDRLCHRSNSATPLGCFPDGRSICWFSHDPRSLFIRVPQHFYNTDNPIRMASLNESQKKLKLLIRTNNRENTRSSLRPCAQGRFCCDWGCSEHLKDSDTAKTCRTILSFSTIAEYLDHISSYHSYGAQGTSLHEISAQPDNDKWLRIPEGAMIQSLCADLTSACCARSTGLFSLTKAFHLKEKNVDVKNLSNCSQSRAEERVMFLAKFMSNLDDSHGSAYFSKMRHSKLLSDSETRSFCRLWSRISRLFSVNLNGKFHLEKLGSISNLFFKIDGTFPIPEIVSKNEYQKYLIDEEAVASQQDSSNLNIRDAPTPLSMKGHTNFPRILTDRLQEDVAKCQKNSNSENLFTDIISAAITSLYPVRGYLDAYRLLLLNLAVRIPSALQKAKSEDKCLYSLWNRSSLEQWISFVRKSCNGRMMMQALIVLINGTRATKLPRWWRAVRSGWDSALGSISTPTLSLLALRINVLDSALKEYEQDSDRLSKSNSSTKCVGKVIEGKPKYSEYVSLENLSKMNVETRMKYVLCWADTFGLERYAGESNDECCICDMGGDLMCCEFCRNVQHVECCKPPLEKFPDFDWVCDLCVGDIHHLWKD